MTDQKKLKPCPFCGGEAELWLEFEPYEDEYTYDERNLWHCGCKRCGITADAYWEEKWAIETWNTRSIIDNLKEKKVMTNTRKTKVELIEEINELRSEMAKIDRYKKYDEAANELAAALDSFTKAGFSREETMQIILGAAKNN